MNESQAWIELALKTLSTNQKELARLLAVSQTQISKWKNGEPMSFEMKHKFRAILSLGEMDPAFVLWAGSLEKARKWSNLIHLLADHAEQGAETGYDTTPLQDELEQLCGQVVDVLTGMKVPAPESFPPEFETYLVNSEVTTDDEHDERLWDLVEVNAYSRLIYAIFNSFNDVWGFFAAYVDSLADDDDNSSLNDTKADVEASLLDLAACKVEIDEEFAPGFPEFKYRVTREYRHWLSALKDAAFRSGTPLKAELLDMVGSDAGALGSAAEAEWLGLNAARLHPDIYMNELLVGMRLIHQVLPRILNKLDIDFVVEDSELKI